MDYESTFAKSRKSPKLRDFLTFLKIIFSESSQIKCHFLEIL